MTHEIVQLEVKKPLKHCTAALSRVKTSSAYPVHPNWDENLWWTIVLKKTNNHTNLSRLSPACWFLPHDMAPIRRRFL